jgi:Ca2+-binding EF-hand superfamily protein
MGHPGKPSSLAPSSTPVQKLDFIFHMYDEDGNGLLDRAECTALISDMIKAGGNQGRQTKLDPETMVNILFDHVDDDKSGSIELYEFRKLATDHNLSSVRDEILQILSPFGHN